MFRTLTYKQKLKLTGIAALLALFLCYRLSISRTLEEYHKYAEETAIAGETGAAGPSITDLQANEARIGGLFRQYALDTLRPEKNLLSVTSNYCKGNGLQLKEYRPFAISQNDSIPVLTRIVTVQGSFIPCLKFLYSLEMGQKVGKLSAADFRSYIDPQDKKTKLDCTLYIQNLMTPDHEEH